MLPSYSSQLKAKIYQIHYKIRENSRLLVGSCKQYYNHVSLIFIAAVTKNNVKFRENWKLVFGSGKQDYNHAFLIFITAVTKKQHKIDLKMRENSKIGGWIW